jgi:DNA mismatch repair ATPase MutS
VARFYKRRVQNVTRTVGVAQHDLKSLAARFEYLEAEKFNSERLRRVDAGHQAGGLCASEAIQRLATLYSWIASRGNPVIVAISGWFLLETQVAFAVEAWRARFGMMVEPWLRRLGEIEALSSLAAYAFEHPADPFPEILPASAPAQIQAECLKHPLIVEARCVGNDVSLGPDHRLIVVGGSNMSGKSTYLRTLGVNLALAGAPVRARKLRMTHLRIGASIRTVDSIQERTSRFYAEITRLGQIVKLAGQETSLVFLLDEILGGTNSHDRRIGAGCVARTLVERGALGLITTHDLALAQITEEIQPPGANYHFEDQILNGKMSFDYRLRPGVVQKSNALELMRLVGLDVTG